MLPKFASVFYGMRCTIIVGSADPAEDRIASLLSLMHVLPGQTNFNILESFVIAFLEEALRKVVRLVSAFSTPLGNFYLLRSRQNPWVLGFLVVIFATRLGCLLFLGRSLRLSRVISIASGSREP